MFVILVCCIPVTSVWKWKDCLFGRAVCWNSGSWCLNAWENTRSIYDTYRLCWVLFLRCIRNLVSCDHRKGLLRLNEVGASWNQIIGRGEQYTVYARTYTGYTGVSLPENLSRRRQDGDDRTNMRSKGEFVTRAWRWWSVKIDTKGLYANMRNIVLYCLRLEGYRHAIKSLPSYV